MPLPGNTGTLPAIPFCVILAKMRRFRDEIAEVCYEMVADGHRLGIISDEEMREFEADCFVGEPEAGSPVAAFREAQRVPA